MTRVDRVTQELATARSALSDTSRLLHTKSRPWYEAGVPLVDEPSIQLTAGRVCVDLAAAEAALTAAKLDASLLDAARGLVGESSLRAASHLFEAAGTTASDDPECFGRHWSALRRSTVADPVPHAFILEGRRFLAAPAERPPPSPLLRAAQEFASTLRPGAAARDRAGRVPHGDLASLAASGLLRANVPIDFGGHGADFATAVQISRLLSVADGSIGQISTIHFSITEQLVRLATPEQKARWLPVIVAGGRVGNAAAERGVTHAKITETRLERDGQGRFILKGAKFYSTGAPGAALIAVLAKDVNGELVTAILRSDAPGLTIKDDWDALGQRSTGSGTTLLDQVPVNANDLLPRWINQAQPSTATAEANLPHVALDLGLARGALEALARLLPAAPDNWTLLSLGRLSARLVAGEELLRASLARLPVVEAEGLTDASVRSFSLQVSVAKAQAADLALDAGEALFDLGGAAALDPALGLDRFWRDARTHTLHDPTRWRLLHIGNHALTGRLPPRNRTN
jgi:alkylation response protein AidB-like acyl-CoA dehydrogenase